MNWKNLSHKFFLHMDMFAPFQINFQKTKRKERNQKLIILSKIRLEAYNFLDVNLGLMKYQKI